LLVIDIQKRDEAYSFIPLFLFYVDTYRNYVFFCHRLKRLKMIFLYEFAKMRLNLVSILCVDALLCASTDMHCVKNKQGWNLIVSSLLYYFVPQIKLKPA